MRLSEIINEWIGAELIDCVGGDGADVRQRHGAGPRASGPGTRQRTEAGQSLVQHRTALDWRLISVQLHQLGEYDVTYSRIEYIALH